MEIRKIWFEDRFLCGEDSSGTIYKQSLLWYPELSEATDEQRNDYRKGFEGFHWPALRVSDMKTPSLLLYSCSLWSTRKSISLVSGVFQESILP